jgi:DNA helicase-2/ATP-dependent DNA helicase PcrA
VFCNASLVFLLLHIFFVLTFQMTIFNKEIILSEKNFLDGNLQIIACAGSGKTEFVSERIAFQISEGIAKPEEIVAFTFTEKAAEELKFRVRSKIKEIIGHQPDIGDMYIGTIHAFAFKILQDFIPRYRAFDMLDDVGRMAFLSSIKFDIDVEYLKNSLNKHFRKPFGKKDENWAFSVFLSDLDKCVEEGWSVDKVATSKSFINAYKVYHEKMEAKRFLDFSSIQRVAVNTLKNDKVALEQVRNQYKFFTVDEYQDVNPIQEELIQIVSGKQNVCVVGDDDQSIYQWRGADVSNILTFENRYPNVKIHKLEINRRSGDRIVHAGRELIERNNPRLTKTIQDKGLPSQDGDLYKLVFNTQEEEATWIVQKIQHLVGSEYMEGGQPRKLMYSDVALLFRSISYEAAPYLEALQSAGIPIVFSGVGGLFDTTEVRGIIQILEYISEIDYNTSYDDDFLLSVHKDLLPIFPLSFSTFSSGVNRIAEWARGMSRLPLQTLYGKILSLLGLARTDMHDREDDVILYNLGRLSKAVSDYEASREYLTFKSIRDFLWFIRLHAENSYDNGPTDANAGLIDAVQILTMHGTKGLGFPAVFIPANHKKKQNHDPQATWIDPQKADLSRYESSEQDERRLYYVAVTRSKKYLFVTNSRIKNGNTRSTGAKDLFHELKDKYFITQHIPDPTNRPSCAIERVSEEARFPTSYSEMAYYLSCGYDYKMRFIYTFDSGIVKELGFGKQVHNVINLLHKEFERTGKIPSKRQISELIEEHFYLRYAPRDVAERMKVVAFKSLEKYVEMWEKDFSLCVKTERPFELEFKNALIVGAIDMIKREASDGSVLEIIDFKTGKPDNDLMEKYELQVQLYTIAAKEALGLDIEKAQVHFLDASKNERLAIGTSNYALETAKQQIGYAIDGVTHMRFQRDARKDKTCQECDWNHICPKRNGYKGK